jgi:hypothetical protein
METCCFCICFIMFLLHIYSTHAKSKWPDYTVNGKDLKKVKTDLKINDRGSNTVLFCKKGGKQKRKLSHETGVSKAEYIYTRGGYQTREITLSISATQNWIHCTIHRATIYRATFVVLVEIEFHSNNHNLNTK